MDRYKGRPQTCHDLQTLPNFLFIYFFDVFLFDYRFCNNLSGLHKLNHETIVITVS
jgi:hypothetical protein